jgi:FixJ family two-component response regulator
MVAIVDDDESVCRALKRLLRTEGMDSEIFLSATEFIQRIERTPGPDCVILDYQLPDWNGLDIQTQLVARGHYLPVVFVTAHDDPRIRERAMAGGAVAFLPKPLDEVFLMASLRRGLEGGNRDDSGA